MRKNKGFSLLLVTVAYVLATGLGICIFWALPSWGWVWRLFAADVGATLLIWLAGLLAGNSSVYDPYWSVAPAVFLPLLASFFGVWNLGTGLLLVSIFFWSLRLTGNWCYTFANLDWQDWRYTNFKTNNPPALWHFLNLFGIHLFPTVVVFLAMLPAFFYLEAGAPFGLGSVLGLVICLLAATLQLVSDTQMHRFRKDPAHAGQVNNQGLWRRSRHPNYLGEVLMWWGVWLMCVLNGVGPWWNFAGALVNTLMFLFVSIPMMEKRQVARRPEYAEYQKQAGMLLPRLR